MFPIWTWFFLVGPSRFFRDLPDFSGISRLVLFLFRGLLEAPTRNIPERVHDTIHQDPVLVWKLPGLPSLKGGRDHLGVPSTHQLICSFRQLPDYSSRTKIQPKEEVFGTDIPRTWGHSRGYPGQKLRSGRSKFWKKQAFQSGHP